MDHMPNPADPLDGFSPAVRAWFTATFGHPTPAQLLGWPPIQRGEHTLILSPTGSGKTLAAFLCAIDRLVTVPGKREGASAAGRRRTAADGGASGAAAGVRTLYISPLKALNNDIQRNLRLPLAGIRREARRSGLELPEIRTAVRSGDTPARERRAVLTTPPHIFITTPESLYLLLTGPRAREMLRTVSTVIVDEIHTLAGNKRGAHLALTLERLEELTLTSPQRIGLSATIRPLEEVAGFLGGAEWVKAPGSPAGANECVLRPRPVTIVDAGTHKDLDLRVESVTADFHNLPGGSLWPLLIPRLLALIRAHRTTLIFANSRRQAERVADRLNEQRAAEERGEDSGLLEQGTPKGLGIMAAGRGMQPHPIRAHHGSMSREARLEMEQDLKAGRLDALVGTSSLQLGIDIGSVDLVAQVGSPKAVSEGLQRVGRAGHLVGQTSKGRIFPLHREDLMEAAVIARGMLRGEVEKTTTPTNPLDVLAQQIVAAVSVDVWETDALFRMVRRARPFHHLTLRALHAVLDMISGRYPTSVHRQLRARVAWDRVNNRLSPLPGSRLLALTNAGTITDRGMFGAYLPDGKTRIGELDEEFVFETRPGDSFMLGAQVWRVLEITEDRIIVAESPGSPPRMPFWHGDYPWRPYELGVRVGAFRREVAQRLQNLKTHLGLEGPLALGEPREDEALQAALATEGQWLQRECALDENSAGQVLDYVATQLDRMEVISSDRAVVAELFEDALGDPRMVVHSSFGGRVNGPWGLVLAAALRERSGVDVEIQSGDDGILLRFREGEGEFPMDLVAAIGPEEARRRLLAELPTSAVFGAQFRRNAARALLLPGLRGRRRTPFWLQRLRAKDLLQAVKSLDDFPLLAETYRDCLEDVMDVPALEKVLTGIQSGAIQVTTHETLVPSPVAQSLLRDFVMTYMYEWDAPKAERALGALSSGTELLQDLLRDVQLDGLLRPEALAETQARLQHTSPGGQARNADELALLLEELGDLTTEEATARSSGDAPTWLAGLAAEGRVTQVPVPTGDGRVENRWVPAELVAHYRLAFADAAIDRLETGRGGAAPAAAERPAAAQEAAAAILERHLASAGPQNQQQILSRYAFDSMWLRRELEHMVESRALAHGRFTPHRPTATLDEYVSVHALEQIHRRTLSILRREVRPVPFASLASFLATWQHVGGQNRLCGPDASRKVMEQLRGLSLPAAVWERDVLPSRIQDYHPSELDGLAGAEGLMWWATGTVASRARLGFFFRGEGNVFLPPGAESGAPGWSENALRVSRYLAEEGAAYLPEIGAELRMTEERTEAALLELVLAGAATNDDIGTARRLLISPEGRSRTERADTVTRRPASSLEQELNRHGQSRPAPRPVFARPGRARLRAAQGRVRNRLRSEDARAAGRWTLLHRKGVRGPEVAPAELAERRARQLLQRYGVVTARSLERHSPSWEWADLVEQLHRLEIRGEARRGYFVRDLPGVQYALPEAVEHLRFTASRLLHKEEPDLLVLNATDPANPYGPPQLSRVASTWVVLDRGEPVLVATNTAARLTTSSTAHAGLLRAALSALLEHLRRHLTRVTVECWNGLPADAGEPRALLEATCFYPDHPHMTWDGYQ